jgi:Cdc6-like AAA superfamily ATPase
MKDRLFWEKYRPKKLEGMILLPRIRKFVQEGIKTNILFYGTPGTGKCVDPETNITVRDKRTGEIKEIKIKDLISPDEPQKEK